jgi:hypothetical protein
MRACRTHNSGAGLLVAALAALAPLAAHAGEAVTARAWLPVALHAADAWADDASLVWIENDAALDAAGRAEAWGFLFFSPGKHAMRSYSVRGGKLEHAEDQALSIAARPLESWVDSDAVLGRAQERARETWGESRLESLLLVRGVFSSETAWVAVFAQGDGPRLFVVCDARDGEVLRAWRG